jgi:predicted alpha/beta-hydrolase family hydrolase
MQTWSQTVLASEKMSFVVPQAGAVSGLLMRPADSKWMLALAHGAGAGMTHPFMGALAEELASFGVATLRYQFPYMEGRKGRPDSPAMAAATVAAAVSTAADAAPDLPLLAGGKSFGGRMTSTAAAERLLHGVRGLVFFGFPLHPPKRPGTKRAEHLENVKMPMLFLQGTRDDLQKTGSAGDAAHHRGSGPFLSRAEEIRFHRCGSAQRIGEHDSRLG